MIIINDIILYFYDFFNPELIIYDKNGKYFRYRNKIYLLKKIKGKYNFFNESIAIKNKFNSFVSLYNNDLYVLLKINCNEKNRCFSIDDLINISNFIDINVFYKKNYYDIWKRKITFIEQYCNEKTDNNKYDCNYYLGLANISLNMIKKVNYSNLSYGISFKRFNDIDSLYDLYDRTNSEIAPITNSFAEYIKYNFFFKNIEVDYKKIFEIEFNYDDYIFFIGRLVFPTYFFDILKEYDIEEKYLLINKKIINYILFIKKIILEIKKRHSNMSLMDIIINLL